MKDVITKKEEIELKHHTRRLSIKDGIFWSARSSFGDQYIAPFSILIGASNSLVAIINSLWNIGLISQLFGGKLVNKHSRKSNVTKALIAESFGWALLLLSAFFYMKDMYVDKLPYLVITAMSIALFSAGIGYPSWFSWMGDVVDKKFRGRWFSKRSTIISFSVIFFAITSALILNYAKNIGYEKLGFVILFGVAFIARASTIKVVRKQYEPKRKKKKEERYALKSFVRELKNSNFGHFTIFRSMLAFVMGITAPLFSIYLLRNLGFDYVTFMAIMLSGTLFSAITLNIWGKISDKYGSYRVIALSTLIIPLTPLLWTLSTSKIYLFFVPALLGGVAWAGFIMASGNFIYDNVPKEKRGKTISYFNLFIGLSALLGGLISAILLKVINSSLASPIIILFIAGSILRMLVVGFWIPRLKEITNKKKFESVKELEHIILKEIKPTLIEDMHEILEIKEYIKE